MASDLKKKLAVKTYELVTEEGIDAVKIRRIANEVGCNSALIYRQFENLDHLITFASIRCLQEYFVDFQKIMSKSTDVLEMHVELWEKFAWYAFNNIPVYELLFWGEYKDQVSDMLFEYHQLFSDDISDDMSAFSGLSASILFNGSIMDREYTILRRLASAGHIHFDDIEVLAHLEISLFVSLLTDYREIYREKGKPKEGADLFMKYLKNLVSKYRIDKKKN